MEIRYYSPNFFNNGTWTQIFSSHFPVINTKLLNKKFESRISFESKYNLYQNLEYHYKGALLDLRAEPHITLSVSIRNYDYPTLSLALTNEEIIWYYVLDHIYIYYKIRDNIYIVSDRIISKEVYINMNIFIYV